MSRKPFLFSATALAVALGLVACGGGSGGGTTETQSGTVTGVITGFGSVFLDGVEYETDGATIVKDGEVVSDDSHLAVGMVVTLRGSHDGRYGNATYIEYDDDVEGPVTAVNLVNGVGTMTVMGQTVTIDGETVVVSSPDVSEPVAVRYAFSMNPVGANLYNKEGIPASPFRTDDW